MFIIIGVMLTGMLLGFLLRNKKKLSWIQKAITALIWLLLFLLGLDVGSNDAIIKNLHSLGVDAIIITLAATLGSVTFAWLLWYYIGKTRRKQAKE